MRLMTTYNPLPISFSYGKGVWLYDETGEAYLDGLSGIGVCNLGYNHPDITRAIQQQAEKLLHTSNTFRIQSQEDLAERLTAITKMEQVFFSNSGAEANETAIKLARLYGHKKGIETPTIIVMNNAFHGRTLATLSASGSRKAQAGFEPLVSGFVRSPFNDIDSLRMIAANRNDIIAIMLEPIQGEGGLHVGEETYLREVAALCEANDWLLIMDEVQTGNGRTGDFYHTLSLNIKPDILTTAKGLGNGVPIGACIIGQRACELFKPGSHGSTFGGNPLVSVAALAVLDVLARDNICEHVHHLGLKFKEKLIQLLGDHPNVRQIRGKGFMLGIEMDRPCLDMRLTGLEHRLLFSVTSESVVRLLPPLIMKEDEIDELIRRLVSTINTYMNKN